MAHKHNLIFLSTLLLILILGTTSLATTDVDKINTETMQNIIDYIITKETTESTKTIYENVDINNLVNHFNTVTAPLLQAQGVEVLEQLILYYSDYNNFLMFIPNNNGIGDVLPFAKISYSTSKSSYLLAYNSIDEIQLKITSSTNFTSSKYNLSETNIGQLEVNYDNSTITSNLLCSVGFPAEVNVKIANTTEYVWSHLYPFVDVYVASSGGTGGDGEDGEDGGDTGGGESGGDTGGGTTTPDYSQNLDNIQTGITDINNNIGETNNKLDNISGELSNINNNLTTVPDMSDTTITNDDITSNLDFEFEQDPYTNFWLELTTGLGNAFTNSKREISIQFRDKTHIISLDNFSIQIPSALKPFLTIISTVFITWKMLQYIKIIIDNISSGNIDEVLEMNEEEGITNLF